MAGSIIVVGNINVDLVMGPVVPWPEPGTEIVTDHSELRVGGSAGNAALALRALGRSSRLVANVGSDVLGEWLAAAFPDESRRWPRAACPTSVSVGVEHPGGERTFLTTPGHLAELSPEDVLSQLPDRARPGDIILLAGIFLSPLLLKQAAFLLAEMASRGFALALDTGWPIGGWTETNRAEVSRWLGAVDHLLLNEIEICGLAKGADVAASVAVIRPKLKAGASLIVKLGSNGAAGWRWDEPASISAPRVAVIDTIGAGDVFNASYLSAHLDGVTFGASLAAGVTAASTAISTRPRCYGLTQ